MTTKVNNLDVNSDPVQHKELAGSYVIQGAVYDLASVIAAVQGDQSADDWNKRTQKDRLAAINEYLTSVEATAVSPNQGWGEQPNAGGDGQDIKDGDGNVIGHEGDGKVSKSEVINDGTEDEGDTETQLANAKVDLEHANKRIADLQNEVQRLTDDANAAQGASKSEVIGDGEGQGDGSKAPATSKPTLHGDIDQLKAPY